MALVVFVAIAAREAGAATPPTAGVATLVAALAAYSATAHAAPLRCGIAAALGLVAGVPATFALSDVEVAAADWLFLPALVLAASMAGLHLRLHRARTHSWRAGARRLADTVDERRRTAAERERARLEAELARIATSLLDDCDRALEAAASTCPDGACAAHIAEVGERARASLHEMRRLVSVLRQGAAETSAAA